MVIHRCWRSEGLCTVCGTDHKHVLIQVLGTRRFPNPLQFRPKPLLVTPVFYTGPRSQGDQYFLPLEIYLVGCRRLMERELQLKDRHLIRRHSGIDFSVMNFISTRNQGRRGAHRAHGALLDPGSGFAPIVNQMV